MSIFASIPLSAEPAASGLPAAVTRVESGDGRVVLTRDGLPVAALVPMTDLRALEELAIEIERDDDGRWIAEVMALPGTLAYGTTQTEARARAAALAFRVMAERLDHGEAIPEAVRALLPAA